MPVDQSLVGRVFPPTRPYAVSSEKIREFVTATGGAYDDGPAPATFPIVLAFDAMNAFLEAESIDLFRIVHGEQRFTYERPVVPGDVLTATLTVSSLRQIAGNDIIGTTSEISDADGALVCSTSATLVHRAGEEEDAWTPHAIAGFPRSAPPAHDSEGTPHEPPHAGLHDHPRRPGGVRRCER